MAGKRDGRESLTAAEPPMAGEPDGRGVLRAGEYASAVARHDTVLAKLLAAARRDVPGLTVDRADDPALALLDAWATVADVVAFYQDRIAAEGYLRTATERLSVVELVRLPGYRAAPAGSATALLAFTVEDSVDPAATVLVPAGTAVQSVPGQGEQPQTFETSADLTAYATRNAMRLRLRLPPRIGPRSLRLAAAESGLRPGDVLLLRLADGPRVRVLSSVQPLPADQNGPATTEIGWDDPVELPPGAAQTQAYALRQRAAVFGHDAPDWRLLPPSTQQGYGAPAGDPGRQWPGFALADPAPGQDALLDLDALHPEIQPGWWLVLRGSGPAGTPDPEPAIFEVVGAGPAGMADFGLTATVTRVRLRGPGRLSAFDRRGAVVFAGGDPLTAAGEPVTEPVAGPVLDLDQPVDLPPGTTLVVRGADTLGDEVRQAAAVATATAADGGTLLTLTAALDTPLVPASVVVLGNVVTATHGRTVAGEVLGSGDGATGYQRFTLRHTDLSYQPAAVPGGVRNSLAVRVDGVPWVQRPSLYGLGPADRAYAMWIGDDGVATLLFGDGTAGARLPSGTENVVADYRSGSGPAGNVRAGTLTLLINRPLGIRAVDNPLPATGGTAPEPADGARSAAPLSVQTFDRVVSLADHEQFAVAFAGVVKATAVALAAGRAPYVHLTVAGPDGAPVPPATVADLRLALDEAGRWGPAPVVANCRRLGFSIAATVATEPDRAAGSVGGDVRAAILDAFAFDRRGFGEPVSAAEVVAVVQAVSGVRSVILTALALSRTAGPPTAADPAPTPEAVAEVLVARPARGAPGGALPAEILVVDADRIAVTEAPW